MKDTHLFRDWFFNLLINFLVNSGWVIVIKDFKRSKDKKKRNYLGLTSYKHQIIYLDKFGGTPRILVHELCHMSLDDFLQNAVRVQPKSVIKKIKGKKYKHKRQEWVELRTEEFEKLFFRSLTKSQVTILKSLINIAKKSMA